MYRKNDDYETHKLSVILKKSQGKWNYKSDSKVMMYDHTLRKQMSPLAFGDWLNSPHIMSLIQQGANLKIATEDFDVTPTKYDNGERRKIYFYFSIKKGVPKKIDNFVQVKTPNYQPSAMRQAQPASPENAQPINYKDTQRINDMDDKLPREMGDEDDWNDQF